MTGGGLLGFLKRPIVHYLLFGTGCNRRS